MMTEMFLDAKQIATCATQITNQSTTIFNRGGPTIIPFKCLRCGNSYTYRKNLMRHINLECGKEPKFQCPHCPRKAKHKAHILRHMKSQHAAII